MTRESLAWAAGFFDGEGNIRSAMRPYHRNPSVKYKKYDLSIAQTDRQVLDRFAAAVTMGKIYGPYKSNTPGGKGKDYWVYSIASFENVPAVIGMLWGFLSPIKREQAAKALSRD